MSSRGFVLTMQYNDDFFLPIWIRHYEKYFNHDSIYVIDHGSDQNFVPPTVNRIYVPRTNGFNELDRLYIVQGIVFALMKSYDYGVFCDSDELILLDGFKQEKMIPKSSIYVYGFDLFKVNVEGKSKIYGIFNNAMCKPLIFNHDYPVWSTGFHGVKVSESPVMSMIMGHLKYINQNAYMNNFINRQAAYETMSDIEKNKGVAQHWNDFSHLTQVYTRAQSTIDSVPLCHDLSQIPLNWTDEINGTTMLMPPTHSYIMDLTNKFHDILI